MVSFSTFVDPRVPPTNTLWYDNDSGNLGFTMPSLCVFNISTISNYLFVKIAFTVATLVHTLPSKNVEREIELQQ